MTTPIKKQSGAVLMFALVMLVILTLLGTSSLQIGSLEERMAGNFYGRAVAFEAAESALRVAERGVATDTTFNSYGFAGLDGTHDITDDDQSVDPAVDSNFSISVAGSSVSSGVNAVPGYYIERLPESKLPSSGLVVGFQDTTPTVQYYRVTARGKGISPNGEVVLQSTYLR